MKEQIISYFDQLGKYKITFTPAIKIKMTPHSPIKWIDDICKIKDQYIITVSTQDDNIKRNIDACTTEELSSINIRLWSLVQDKNRPPAAEKPALKKKTATT